MSFLTDDNGNKSEFRLWFRISMAVSLTAFGYLIAVGQVWEAIALFGATVLALMAKAWQKSSEVKPEVTIGESVSKHHPTKPPY